MTLDVSLEAIEADLLMADRGGQVAAIALARAQVRATLLASGHRLGYAVRPGDSEPAVSAPEPSPVEEPTAAQWAAAASQDVQVAFGDDADVFTVPKTASWEDRVTAAAMLLGIDKAILMLRLHDADGTWQDRLEAAAVLLAVPPDVLQSLFARGGFDVPGGDPLVAPDEVLHEAPPLVDPTRITTRNTEDDPRNDEEPDHDTEDVFAEARKARSKK